MILDTKRLLIRPTNNEDTTMIYEMLSNPQTMTYFVEGTYTLGQVVDIIKNNQEKTEHYSIILKDTSTCIGKISYHKWFMDETYEMGWIMHPSYINQGYMKEATKAVLAYGFDTLKLHRVVATCQPENIASKRICENLGMRLEGTFIRCIKTPNGTWWDELFYAILQQEYKNE